MIFYRYKNWVHVNLNESSKIKYAIQIRMSFSEHHSEHYNVRSSNLEHYSESEHLI